MFASHWLHSDILPANRKGASSKPNQQIEAVMRAPIKHQKKDIIIMHCFVMMVVFLVNKSQLLIQLEGIFQFRCLSPINIILLSLHNPVPIQAVIWLQVYIYYNIFLWYIHAPYCWDGAIFKLFNLFAKVYSCMFELQTFSLLNHRLIIYND